MLVSTVRLPEKVPVVPLIAAGVDPPITVPSMVPPLMSADVIAMDAIVPPSTLLPLIWLSASVSVPAETSSVLPEPTVILDVAIVAPSMVPPLMSMSVIGVSPPSSASMLSRSVFSLVPQVSSLAPTSGFTKP